MKRIFKIEINYEELEENKIENTEVLHDVSIEIAIENLMEAYKRTNSIKGNYKVTVDELFQC